MRDTPVSHYLLGALFVLFLAQMAVPGLTEALYFDPAHLQPWMFITSVFLHGGIMHLLFNAYALFAFGPTLEERLGRERFLLFYLAAGVVGNLLFWGTILLGIIPPVPALGASGAIYGILGALSVLAPHLVLLFWGIIPVPIRTLTALWIITEALGSFDATSGIGSAAHLGGLLFGIAAAWALSKMERPELPSYVVHRGRLR